ncbi:MAG: VOC family protein [Pseudomonadota bacterium]
MSVELEHANYTVSDAHRTADWMCKLFGWRIRWEGPTQDGGQSLHVGTEDTYLALYQPPQSPIERRSDYVSHVGLNHIGVVVDDVKAMEKAITDAGFTPHGHADYEPGRRFYFHDLDGIEYEVVQYG